MQRLLLTAVGALLLSGCAAKKPMYHWGSYPELVREMYVEPGKATPEVQIEKLTADIQTAEANGQKVPPGLFIHLPMMYDAAGKPSMSQEALAKEKERYPESITLINTLINNQKGAQ